MTIILVGGGSGGHITPLLAVAAELKLLQPTARLIYLGQRGDKLADVPAQDKNIDEIYTVSAGKFRRYNGAGVKQLLDIPSLAKNSRDFFRAVKGLGQARRLLKKIKPDIIFIKGGFVGVPVGLAAAQLGIPYVTHDSDAIPGLANRIIARWAAAHAVALPKELYGYSPAKTFVVGVPVASDYKPVTAELERRYRQELKIANTAPVIFVTGGGNGAQRLNEAVVAIVPQLFERYPELVVLHAVGPDHVESTKSAYAKVLSPELLDHIRVEGFVRGLYRYSGAADLIITRAGATSIAEFAAQAKACIMVPNPQLTGGHQVKNAQVLAAEGAVRLVTETQLDTSGAAILEQETSKLLDDSANRNELGKKIAQFAHPQAAQELARLLLKTLQHARVK